jgi:hypothetical protein
VQTEGLAVAAREIQAAPEAPETLLLQRQVKETMAALDQTVLAAVVVAGHRPLELAERLAATAAMELRQQFPVRP